MNVNVFKANNYNLIIGNNWLRQAKAVINQQDITLTMQYGNQQDCISIRYSEAILYKPEKKSSSNQKVI